MPKEAVFTMKLEPELRADFMAEAKASHRPASQLLRELMRDFVQRQKQAREYEDFVRGKVDLAREQIVKWAICRQRRSRGSLCRSARRGAEQHREQGRMRVLWTAAAQ